MSETIKGGNGEGPDNPNVINNLKDFYDAIDNPIDNDETMLSIIDAYSKRDDGFGGLYGSLQRVGVEQKEHNYINPTARQRFEEKMYDRWRHSVIDMTYEEFIDAKNANTLGNGFVKIRNFLKTHPECSTESELRKAISEIPNKEESYGMFDILKMYNWNLKDSWTHVKSRYVNARQEERINVEHRFYLNTDSTTTHATVDALVDCYEKNHLPYYFKFDEPGDRADTIVIYTSTKDLLKNLDVLRQLKEERPDLAEHFHQPPVLTGIIDDNIGYGAEPEQGSYSGVRANLLENVLKSTTIDWVATHQNDIEYYRGKRMPFYDCLVEMEVERLKNDFSKRFSRYLESERKWQQKGKGKVDEAEALENVTKQLGFNQEDLQGQKMYDFFKKQLHEHFPAMIKSFQATGGYDLTVMGKHDKKIQLGGNTFMVTLEKLAPKIAKHDKTYLDDIRSKIYEKCKNYGIDPDKFAFDNLTVKKMKQQYRKEKGYE
ncbi:MAG: hypothetical protein Q4A70_00555 [Candidatus Saccharibacteria bacterium]|nr:hypothetical protein [Candidatus Saccharibacteria bacterium]